MDAIETIDDLIECLSRTEPSKYGRVFQSINIKNSEFQKYSTWKEGDYTRNCIARNKKFEIILLCWDEGAKTKIHDHDGQNCWVYQLTGCVQESRFRRTDAGVQGLHKFNLDEGKFSFMNDRMGCHLIENISSYKAMTLHIYVNPIDECQVYNQSSGEFESVELEYDTVNFECTPKQRPVSIS